MFSVHTILHPTDFTEQSLYAWHVACALARDYGARLVILHVYPTPVVPVLNAGVFPVTLEVPREELFEELKEIRPVDPTLVVERVLLEGEPAHEILRVAEKYAADLIVMGTHGRKGLTRLVMGSVAEKVTRKATCPVLTVRTPLGEIRSESAKTAQGQMVGIS